MIIPYRRFGTTYRSHRFVTLAGGTDLLSQNVGKELPLIAASSPRRAQFWSTSQRKPEIRHSLPEVYRNLSECYSRDFLVSSEFIIYFPTCVAFHASANQSRCNECLPFLILSYIHNYIWALSPLVLFPKYSKPCTHKPWVFMTWLIFCLRFRNKTELEIKNSLFWDVTPNRRTRVRFPMVSLEFFIDTILPVVQWPWGRLSL